MTASRRAMLLASAALGLGASGMATYVHYKLLTDPLYVPACDLGGAVNCTQAYTSQYGSFMGVPVAPLGLLFFVIVFLLLAIGGRASSPMRDAVPSYVFALSTIGLAFVLYLAWASYMVLGVFCVWCAITYVAVIAIFIISGGAASVPMASLPHRASTDMKTLLSKPLPLLVALLLIVGAGFAIALFPRESSAVPAEAQLAPVTDQERQQLAQWWEMQPKVTVPVPDNGAKVVVVKFNDYQCPACKTTHDIYKPVWAKHAAGGQVRYVVKHYPLEAECNPHANLNHYASCEAAAGVIMARAKGTAARLENWLFEHLGPPLLTGDQVKEATKTIGGIPDFDARYARALEEVKADIGLGQLLGVNSTPTFFINGRRLPQLLQPQHIDVLIELELQRPE